MTYKHNPKESMRSGLLTRLAAAIGTLQQSRQDWLLKREMVHDSGKKSILFLYPVVIKTYDQIYYPRFDCLLEDITCRNLDFRPETN